MIGEREDVLTGAAVVGGRLAVTWLHHAASTVTVHDLDSTDLDSTDLDSTDLDSTDRASTDLCVLDLPDPVTVVELTGRPDDPMVHLMVTSFTEPARVLQHDLGSGVTTELVGSAIDLPAEGDAAVVVEQVRVASADGTQVPVFLVHRRDVTPGTGPHPTLLYGYGGFRASKTPEFAAAFHVWVERGGVLAVANLRGGGEYGARWHDAGRLSRKQNVFDDAIATALWLTEQGWTTSERLAATGRSNGGLLVGALLTQRPELFGAVVPEVGVLDMLRFQHFTIGWAWTSDYGDADVDAGQFATLRAYSPLHNLRDGATYPATMVMTGDHDDRVVPAHSYKFAAELQACQGGPAPILRVETSTGHGAGKPTSAQIAERTDVLAFLTATLR